MVTARPLKRARAGIAVDEPPGEHGEARDGQNAGDEEAENRLGKGLGGGAAGSLTGIEQAVQLAGGAGCGGTDSDGAVQHPRAGENRVAGVQGCRKGFTGVRELLDERAAGLDFAIGGDDFAGPDFEQLASGYPGDGDFREVLAGDGSGMAGEAGNFLFETPQAPGLETGERLGRGGRSRGG